MNEHLDAHTARLPYPAPGCACRRCESERERLRSVWETNQRRKATRKPRRRGPPRTRTLRARRGELYLCHACLRYTARPVVCEGCETGRAPARARVRWTSGEAFSRWIDCRGWSNAQAAAILGVTGSYLAGALHHGLTVQVERVRTLARAAGWSWWSFLRATRGEVVDGRHPQGKVTARASRAPGA